MPQLNVLSVEISQSPDFKSEVSSRSSEKQIGDGSFSKVMDRHIAADKSGNSINALGNGGNKLSKQAPDQTSFNEKVNAEDKVELKLEKLNEKSAPVDSLEKEANSQKIGNEDVDTISTEDGAAIVTKDLALLNNEQLPVVDLTQFEQSQTFMSLVNSANNILQPALGDQSSNGNDNKINIEINGLLEKQQGIAGDFVSDSHSNKSQPPASSHEALALKIGQTIKNEQFTIYSPGKPTLDASNNSLSDGENIGQGLNNSIVDEELLATDKLVEQVTNNSGAKGAESKKSLATEQVTQLKSALLATEQVTQLKSEFKYGVSEQMNEDTAAKDTDEVTELIKALEPQLTKLSANAIETELTLKDANKTSQSLNSNASRQQTSDAREALLTKNTTDGVSFDNRINAEGMEQASHMQATNTLSSAQLKNTESKTDNHQAYLSQQVAEKVNLDEQNSTDSQSKNSQTDEQQHEQNLSMVNPSNQNIEGIETKKSFVNPNVFSAPEISVQELESSQHSMEEMSNGMTNEITSQVKNNAMVLNETVSILKKDFAEAVKDKIMVIISQKLQQFDIRLDPPELGNVHVRVNLQNEQAVVNFVVQNQQAKEVFEDNLGKLKDMLSQNGVDVGDANVEQQTPQSGNDENNSDGNNKGSDNQQNDLEAVESILSANLFKSSSSSVDYYA